MSSPLGVEETLNLSARLAAAVQEFTAREAALNREFTDKSVALQRNFESGSERHEAELAESRAREEAAFVTARDAIAARWEHRRASIRRAEDNCRAALAALAAGIKDRQKFRAQKVLLQAGRTRETDRETAQKTYKDFVANLAMDQQELEMLDQLSREACGGFPALLPVLAGGVAAAPGNPATDEFELLTELRELKAQTADELAHFQRRFVAGIFRHLPLWLLLFFIALGHGVLAVGVHYFKWNPDFHKALAGTGVLTTGLAIWLWRVARRQTVQAAEQLGNALATARELHDRCARGAAARLEAELQRCDSDYERTNDELTAEWKKAVQLAAETTDAGNLSIITRVDRAGARNERLSSRAIAAAEARHAAAMAELQERSRAQADQLSGGVSSRLARTTADHEAAWQALAGEWQQRLRALFDEVRAATEAVERLFPAWDSPRWQEWRPPRTFGQAARLGQVELDLHSIEGGLPADTRLALPGPAEIALPLSLLLPDQASLLFETGGPGRDAMMGALNSVILRLLATTPPGKLCFTIYDPIGLGQNFSGVMHLADYEENLINSRIWTQAAQIEKKLAELNEHMEKVIQMYLRNEYQTLTEYNEQAGNIAEKHHFVVIADFPTGFTELAARRLLSIAASGARCGVFTLIQCNPAQSLPQDFDLAELRKSSVCIGARDTGFFLKGRPLGPARLVLDAAPDPALATDLIHRIGKGSLDSNRVEVPFEQIAPAEAEYWTNDTADELRIPIGRSGATKLQLLAIGKGTRQHALVAGKTGSGKSTLFHVMITNLALACGPDQVEFYLVDFKKGVEFKCYGSGRLPHARVVAIESDREFGLSVLQRVDDELRRRGDLFRQAGVQDLAGYRRSEGAEPMPRTLLIIDEFQEFFTEDDRIAQGASVLMDRIVRQGRAFGIHVILGSQTLGGAYTLARTTFGQMVIRIALQCNEADAYLIMDENNPAPRLLSRPGEGIYNDAAGALEGNSPFQAVWLADHRREEYIALTRRLADQRSRRYPGPIVFEGNAPADVRENTPLADLLDAERIATVASPRAWMGAPNSIKGPTEAVYHRQSGNHLLIVGQREEAALAILAVSMISLAAQRPPSAARFILFDGSPPDSAQQQTLAAVARALPHSVRIVKAGEIAAVMNELGAELKEREEHENVMTAPAVFVVINGLQKFKKLRQEDDFSYSSDEGGAVSPGVQLGNLINEGSAVGIHLLVACDTYNNVNRALSRKAQSEFEMRVVFQMGANDSASLIDSPKATTLGLHRALFFNEQEGHLETFRPYALPSVEWLEEVAAKLARACSATEASA